MKTRKILLGAIAAVVPVLAIAGFAAGGGGQSSLATCATRPRSTTTSPRRWRSRARSSSRRWSRSATGTCIQDLSGPGAMGIHILIQSRVDDKLVPTEPEAILYEKRNDGTYKLTGVEYVVASTDRPTLYGQEFDQTNLARYGSPAATVWTLHVWAWKPNPDPERGIFAPWNTRVTCS